MVIVIWTSARIAKILAVLCAFVVMVGVADAVQPYTPRIADPLQDVTRWQKFAEFDGREPRCVVEDGAGNMWFGVAEGVIRYNGVEWTGYSAEQGLTVGRVNALCVAQDGTMYAGADSGLFRLRGERWEQILPAAGAKKVSVAAVICAHDGTIWAAAGNGVLKLTPAAMAYYVHEGQPSVAPAQTVFVPKSVLLDHVVQNVFEDNVGFIWCGVSSGELLRLDPRKPDPASASAWTIMSALPGFHRSYVYVFIQRPNGEIWVGGDNHNVGLNCFDPATGKWSYIDLPKMFGTDGIVRSILQTRDGTVWAGGFAKLFKYANGQWHLYRAPEVPFSSSRLTLAESRRGELWVLGIGDDVQRIDYLGQRWCRYEGLNFQCETPDRRRWFIAIDDGIVCEDGPTWSQYSADDGVMASPAALLTTRKGELWAAGSDHGHAAIARFTEGRWQRFSHKRIESDFSSVIDYRAVTETPDGSLWFGAYVNGRGGGVLQYDPAKGGPETESAWTVHTGPGTEFSFGFAVGKGGVLYSGSYRGLMRHEGDRWGRADTREVDALTQSADGVVWVGTRGRGVLRLQDGKWTTYTIRDGLRANGVTALFVDRANHLWVGTGKGISQYDGNDWVTDVFPGDSVAIAREGGGIKETADGSIWINQSSREWMRRTLPDGELAAATARNFCTVRYRPETLAPKTTIVTGAHEVSQPGNTAISWRAVDPWWRTPENELRYSHRLDGGPWSRFSTGTNQVLLAVPVGKHRFEVRARDRDLNIESEPASVEFVVVPPVWRQAWFIALVGILLGGVAAQTSRVIRRDRRLRASNRSLFAEVEDRKRAEADLQEKTRQLEEKTDQLEDEIEERRSIQSELERQKVSLETEIEERKRMEREVEKTHKELMLASHQAGMAEVAIGVLHNIGNVLNSINVSATLAEERWKQLKPASLGRAAEMLEANVRQPDFLVSDPKGKLLPSFIKRLAEHWTVQQDAGLKEIGSLRQDVEHVKEIVATQQSYARFSGVTENLHLTEVIEDAIRMNRDALRRHRVELVRDFQTDGTVQLARNKAVQILVNLIQNAKNACVESDKVERRIVLRTQQNTPTAYEILVTDNGVGIAPENMPRLFNHGFTTRKHGHGFGLHSSANAAKAIGGKLSVTSPGLGAGATFILELPLAPPPGTY